VSQLPGFNAAGDLPQGIHLARLEAVLQRFGSGSDRRQAIGERLRRVHAVAATTGEVTRFVVFGSFVTATPLPNDVDVFLLMTNTFDSGRLKGEAAILFDNAAAQVYFGDSIFWLRSLAALGGEAAMIEDWQIKRDGSRRGIIEVVANDPE
jgi:hypothetical protein